MEGQKTIKLLNALPIAAITTKSAILEIQEITAEQMRDLLVNATIESYIGHPSTSRAVSEIVGREIPTNRAEAKILPGDVLVVVTLTRRVQGDVEVTPGDLRFFLVKVK